MQKATAVSDLTQKVLFVTVFQENEMDEEIQ